jgi:hypothetical protein
LFESGTPADRALAGATIRTKGTCLAGNEIINQNIGFAGIRSFLYGRHGQKLKSDHHPLFIPNIPISQYSNIPVFHHSPAESGMSEAN